MQAQADAVIAMEMEARAAREAARKAFMEAVPAFEEWEVDHGAYKTILRRVAPPEPVKLSNRTSTSEVAAEPQWTEAQFAAWIAEQPSPRKLNLTATVFDETLTKVTWRDESRMKWTILSNIDFRYLRGVVQFEDKTNRWMSFLFVDEVDSTREKEIALHAAEKGFQYEPRTLEPWLSLVPADFMSSTEPEYIIMADSESTIPEALYEELDALHRHYAANEEQLIAAYEYDKVMSAARRAWHEANPPEPKDTVINFWKVR
ncbi:MAG: hypothetical protein EA353_10495 [Puniceicoccaceae bacterium]|nr:MAG: hypothetical protein EA353_10495 [Puniceicoccaceae bacterium]